MSCDCIFPESLIRSKKNSKWDKKKRNPHPLYHVWLAMIHRCLNPKNSNYPNYGGRGIKVTQNWVDGFENFFKDMGPKPDPDFSIDRCNNDGNYCPHNCRWADRKTQSNNRRQTRLKNNKKVASSGVKGVQLTPYGKYLVAISFDGKRHYLGTYPSLKEASEVANKIFEIKKQKGNYMTGQDSIL